MDENIDIDIVLPEGEAPVEPEVVRAGIVNMKVLANWVSREAGLDPDAEQILATVLENHKDQLSAFMVAASRYEAVRSVQIIEYIEQLQTELMSPLRLQRTDSKTLMAMMRSLSSQLKNMFDRIDKRIDGPGIKININDTSVAGMRFDIPELNARDSRDRVRTALQILFKVAEKLDFTEQELVNAATKQDPNT